MVISEKGPIATLKVIMLPYTISLICSNSCHLLKKGLNKEACIHWEHKIEQSYYKEK